MNSCRHMFSLPWALWATGAGNTQSQTEPDIDATSSMLVFYGQICWMNGSLSGWSSITTVNTPVRPRKSRTDLYSGLYNKHKKLENRHLTFLFSPETYALYTSACFISIRWQPNDQTMWNNCWKQLRDGYERCSLVKCCSCQLTDSSALKTNDQANPKNKRLNIKSSENNSQDR